LRRRTDAFALSRICEPRVNAAAVTHLRLLQHDLALSRDGRRPLSPLPIAKVKNVVCPARPIWVYVRALHTNSE